MRFNSKDTTPNWPRQALAELSDCLVQQPLTYPNQ
jgi:hypothetical protein